MLTWYLYTVFTLSNFYSTVGRRSHHTESTHTRVRDFQRDRQPWETDASIRLSLSLQYLESRLIEKMSEKMSEKTTGLEVETQDQGSSHIKSPPKVLSASEKTILDRQLHGLPAELKVTNLLSYATTFDKFVIAISIASAIIAGTLNPLLTVSPPYS